MKSPKLVKISPGEKAMYWESDCRPNNIMCVGWEDVGDLRKYKDYETFKRAFGEAYPYNGNKSKVTTKANELWILKELGPGDLIAANRGTKEILAVGEIIEPGYEWDESRETFNHILRVKWDLNRSGNIPPQGRWGMTTVEVIEDDLRNLILSLNKKSQHMPKTPLKTDDSAAKNVILFGPPGTGKTHNLVQLQEKYTEKPDSQSREEWLHSIVADYGWRAVIAAALEDGEKTPKQIREHELFVAKAKANNRTRNLSPTLWNYLHSHSLTPGESSQNDPAEGIILFQENGKDSWTLVKDWRDIDDDAASLVDIHQKGPTTTSAAVRRYRTVTFHPSYCYEDFVRGIRPVGTEDEGRTEFRMVDGVFKQICDEARANPTKRYALFIDEINRGNIAKIFGELITLIEPDKRITVAADGSVKGMTVHLPGSNTGEVAEPPFGVPANLDIYGTMNTADRSIALLDIALRRRFEFVEMPPRYEANIFPAPVAGVDRGALLWRINDRLEYLLDRDHRIGHAYLMKAQNLADLRSAFASQIIPLLQEYFFDDLGKVALVLSGPNGRSEFVEKKDLRHADLFPGDTSRSTAAIRHRYEVTPPGTWTAEHFQGIYTTATAAESTEDEAAS